MMEVDSGVLREELRQVLEFPDVAPPGTLSSLTDEIDFRWWEQQAEALAPDVRMHLPQTLLDWLDLLGNGWDTLLDAHNRYYKILQRARADFIKEAAALTQTRILRPPKWKKHYPVGLTSLDAIRRAVFRDSDSRFFPQITPAHLQYLLQDAITQRIECLWPVPSHFLMDIDATYIVGCSRKPKTSGDSVEDAVVDTTFVRFDCHFDTQVAHGYPILENDANVGISTGLRCSYDSLLGYLEKL